MVKKTRGEKRKREDEEGKGGRQALTVREEVLSKARTSKEQLKCCVVGVPQRVSPQQSRVLCVKTLE